VSKSWLRSSFRHVNDDEAREAAVTPAPGVRFVRDLVA
jgi:hypothetical protein